MLEALQIGGFIFSSVIAGTKLSNAAKEAKEKERLISLNYNRQKELLGELYENSRLELSHRYESELSTFNYGVLQSGFALNEGLSKKASDIMSNNYRRSVESLRRSNSLKLENLQMETDASRAGISSDLSSAYLKNIGGIGSELLGLYEKRLNKEESKKNQQTLYEILNGKNNITGGNNG